MERGMRDNIKDKVTNVVFLERKKTFCITIEENVIMHLNFNNLLTFQRL